HRNCTRELNSAHVPLDLLRAARDSWDEALRLGQSVGFRNSQATVIAPTGTIAFMMDCDTTGIEPDIALIKYKKLVGGGMLKIVNQTVPRALKRLGYSEQHVKEIMEYVDENEPIEGAPHLKAQPLSTSKDQTKVKVEAAPGVGVTVETQARAVRRRLPDERRAITHKFSIAGHDGYVTVGMYEDNQPGEIFLVMAKEGSVVSGLMDCYATAVAMPLQYGVPLH